MLHMGHFAGARYFSAAIWDLLQVAIFIGNMMINQTRFFESMVMEAGDESIVVTEDQRHGWGLHVVAVFKEAHRILPCQLICLGVSS